MPSSGYSQIALEASGWLVEPTDLLRALPMGGIQLLDTRSEVEYWCGHLPGARNLRDIFTYLCTLENGGTTALLTHFAEALGALGIHRETPVILYEDAADSGFGQSCRGLFLLKLLGHSRVRVLNGGLQSWKALELALETRVSAWEPVTYAPRPDLSLLLEKEDILRALNDPAIPILDTRGRMEWEGQVSSPYGVDFCPRKGHLPGAIWLDWRNFIDIRPPWPRFRTVEETRSICRTAGIPEDRPLYLYCFKGSRASHTLIALRRAGYDARLYFASWNEWSRDPSLPWEGPAS